ncbi:MAG: biopolymer transporter ExbD [Myxococcales bacterium]|nr:biopolymer transporter ExbD [Myxococcales bacterium]
MDTPQDHPLSPAQRSKIRRLSRPREAAPGDEAGELNIIPYLDIIMNIVVFVMTSLAVIFYSTIDSEPPSLGGGKPHERASSKALNLVALVVSDGVTLKTAGGQIDSGCASLGSGITVPRLSDGHHNLAEITRCARFLKSQNERFAEETQVTVTGNPGTPYREIIEVIDALRRDDLGRCDPPTKEDGDRTGCLFPDIHFGQAR